MLLYNQQIKQSQTRKRDKIMKEITRENAVEVLAERTECLKEVANVADQFIDYAEICCCLRDMAKAILVIDVEHDHQYDITTKTNLEVLTEILDASSKLFVSCDEYYR